jgi:multidrug efflux system membrane fusion protein
VWVLDKATMTVRSQPVQIATADGNEAVIAAGLAARHEVVSAGVHVLSPGQKVTVYEEKTPAAAGPRRPPQFAGRAPCSPSPQVSTHETTGRRPASTFRAGRSSMRRSRAT